MRLSESSVAATAAGFYERQKYKQYVNYSSPVVAAAVGLLLIPGLGLRILGLSFSLVAAQLDRIT